MGHGKNYVAGRNVTFKLDDVIKPAKEKFAAITAENWANLCWHVDEVGGKYMSREHRIDDALD